jgi:hypothetical protein
MKYQHILLNYLFGGEEHISVLQATEFKYPDASMSNKTDLLASAAQENNQHKTHKADLKAY